MSRVRLRGILFPLKTAHPNEELLVAEIEVDELAEPPLKLISRRRAEMYGEILLTNEEAAKVSGDFMVPPDK